MVDIFTLIIACAALGMGGLLFLRPPLWASGLISTFETSLGGLKVDGKMLGEAAKVFFSGQTMEQEDGTVVELDHQQALYMLLGGLLEKLGPQLVDKVMGEMPAVLSTLYSSNSAKELGAKGGSAFATGAAALGSGFEHQAMLKTITGIVGSLGIGGGGKGGAGGLPGMLSQFGTLMAQAKESGIFGSGEPGAPNYDERPPSRGRSQLGGKIGGN